MKKPVQGSTYPKAQRPTQWLSPSGECAKVNVDAAIRGTSRAGSAVALCRDKNGTFIGASALVIKGIHDPTALEALVVRESMALADDLGLNSIHVASDCKIVIDDIKQNSGASYCAIIHEIIEYSNSFSTCNFFHEFRSLNFEAHNLAKHALQLGFGRHVWLGHPS